MFSWLGVAILEFSFTIDKQLLTTLEMQEKIQAFTAAKGQGGNMLRPESTPVRVLSVWSSLLHLRALSSAVIAGQPLHGAHLQQILPRYRSLSSITKENA